MFLQPPGTCEVSQKAAGKEREVNFKASYLPPTKNVSQSGREAGEIGGKVELLGEVLL